MRLRGLRAPSNPSFEPCQAYRRVIQRPDTSGRRICCSLRTGRAKTYQPQVNADESGYGVPGRDFSGAPSAHSGAALAPPRKSRPIAGAHPPGQAHTLTMHDPGRTGIYAAMALGAESLTPRAVRVESRITGYGLRTTNHLPRS